MNCRASMNEAAVAASSGELTDRAVEGELWWTAVMLAQICWGDAARCACR